LAALRIGFALYLLSYYLRFAGAVEQCFSNLGVYSPYLIPDVAPPPIVAWLIFGAALVACLALLLGWHTRLTVWIVLLLFVYHYLLNFAVANTSYDRLNLIALTLLCLSDSGAAWSLDARGRSEVRLVPAWQIRLPQFQLAMLYFGSGLWKLLNPYWRTGEMMKYTLASPWASPVAYWILDWNLPDWFYLCLTWSVVIFELLAGLGFFFRRTRPWFIAMGIAFHVSNTVVLMIPGFLNCIAMYGLFWPWWSRRRPSQSRD